MELRFSDDNYVSDDNYEKYWQQNVENVEKTTKKKKISFDDILTNMNLVVNKGGVLQFMSVNKESEQTYNPQQQTYSTNPQQQTYSHPQQPLDPSVKHSYIYNKYFKDYNDATPAAPEVKVPKTKEEYLKMLVEEKIRQNEERKRISQIKSTKLLFTTNVGNQGTIPVSKNGLRKMGFQ